MDTLGENEYFNPTSIVLVGHNRRKIKLQVKLNCFGRMLTEEHYKLVMCSKSVRPKCLNLIQHIEFLQQCPTNTTNFGRTGVRAPLVFECMKTWVGSRITQTAENAENVFFKGKHAEKSTNVPEFSCLFSILDSNRTLCLHCSELSLRVRRNVENAANVDFSKNKCLPPLL